jgi:hypothetical protein
LSRIETVVKNGELSVRMVKGVKLPGNAPIKITVNVRNVDNLSLASSIAGSGRITIKDLQSDELSVSIACSGRFEAQGTAKAMEVSIAGSGDATLWVRKALTVSIAGSGNVSYLGEGVLRDTSTMGSGHVKQMGSAPGV